MPMPTAVFPLAGWQSCKEPEDKGHDNMKGVANMPEGPLEDEQG